MATADDFLCAEEFAEFFDGLGYCQSHMLRFLGIRFGIDGVDGQSLSSSIHHWIYAPYELILVEDGHHVGPVLAFVLWHINLQAVTEVEQLFSTLTVTDEIVEG